MVKEWTVRPIGRSLSLGVIGDVFFILKLGLTLISLSLGDRYLTIFTKKLITVITLTESGMRV